jgi:hypothetical protein
MSGWLVAGTHRQFQRTMVLAFFASRCVLVLPGVGFLLLGILYEPQYLDGFLKLAFGNGLSLLAILVGGGLFGKSMDSAV